MLRTVLRLSIYSLPTLPVMRVTRSASRAVGLAVQKAPEEIAEVPKVAKRKAAAKATNSRKKARVAEDAESEEAPKSPAPKAPIKHVKPVPTSGGAHAMVPAELTFSFDEAKQHLIRADSRFEPIFNTLGCRPFEQLERVDPFRTLTQSILGQQISWLAARSITHRFIRLFDPSLPEKPTDYDRGPDSFFPTAEQVAEMDIPTLRSAGLSQRKAEYVQDLAARFADGRLSTEKVLDSEDEELYEMLTAVRGIGRWTVDMFAMFSLRRPDILPVGDLGVQRGLLRWLLALHSPSTHNIHISPRKLPKAPDEEPSPVKKSSKANGAADDADEDTLPVLSEEGVSSVPPAPGKVPKTAAKGKGKKKATTTAATQEEEEEAGILPAPASSIDEALNMPPTTPVSPLPKGVTVAQLRTRLQKKEKIKGAFLTPQEMDELTASWRPYRSIGVYYMWALAEEAK